MVRGCHLISLPLLWLLPTAALAADEISIRQPKRLGVDRIPCQRVPLGEPDDYKPCIVLLPDGSLRLVAFHQFRKEGERLLPMPPGNEAGLFEQMLMFRSDDDGQTWSKADRVPLVGREPYFSITRDGTLLLTAHLLQHDVRNTLGVTHSYLHRSSDAGRTWETTRIAADDVPGAPAKGWVVTSRNVLELADGTLVLGVSAPGGVDFLWRSRDKGKTWDKSLRCEFQGVGKSKLWWPFMGETVLWQARNGDLLGLWRVDHRVFPMPGAPPPNSAEDVYERLIVFRSRDGGRNWGREKEFGSDYAEFYPSILRLTDGRLLLTFTVRGRVNSQQLGVQAVLGEETDDGFAFDFRHDRLILDPRTPMDQPQGGGFGPTVQLTDGTLVTGYSYRAPDGKTHLEVVRWTLPPDDAARP